MIRNSILYRRYWYAKKRREGRIRTYIRIMLIAVVLFIFVFYTNKQLLPSLAEISVFKVESRINRLIYDVLQKNLNESIKYDNLMMISRDSYGRITSVQANYAEMNRLSAHISADIQEEISHIESENIPVPMGLLSGVPILSGSGPDIYVKIKLAGSMQIDFKSEFSELGINQTRHKIFLQVYTRVGVMAPLLARTAEITTSIPVAETIIVGNVPQVYGSNK